MLDSSNWDRRRFLAVVGGMSVLAGCAGDEEGGPGNETGSETDDEEGQADDTAGGSEEDGEDTGGEEGDGEDTGGNGETEGDDDDGNAQFGEITQFADSYAFEGESSEEGETFLWSGRVHEGRSYMRMEENGEVMEMYFVGEETYVVQGGECSVMSSGDFEGLEEERAGDLDLEGHEEEAVEHPELEAVGRDTIDGEAVHVFELSADEAAEHDVDVTYYVSVETGYLRRVEYESAVMDFHSWGSVDPIEPPDMECMDMGDWGGDAREDDDETPAIHLP